MHKDSVREVSRSSSGTSAIPSKRFTEINSKCSETGFWQLLFFVGLLRCCHS